MIIEDDLFDYCLESVTCDYVSEGFKDVLKKAGTIASDAAKNAGNLIITIINTIINTIRKCINTIKNIFRKATGKETKEFQKKDVINYKFKTSAFKKKEAENIAKEKEARENKIKELEDKVKKLEDDNKDIDLRKDRIKKNYKEEIEKLEDEIKKLKDGNANKDNEIKTLQNKRDRDIRLLNAAEKDYNYLKNADPKYIDYIIKEHNLKNINIICRTTENLASFAEELYHEIEDVIKHGDEDAIETIRKLASMFDRKATDVDNAGYKINYELQPMTVSDFREASRLFLFEDRDYYGKIVRPFDDGFAHATNYLKKIATMASNLEGECKSLVLTSLNKYAMILSKTSLDINRELEKLKQAVYAYAAQAGRWAVQFDD